MTHLEADRIEIGQRDVSVAYAAEGANLRHIAGREVILKLVIPNVERLAFDFEARLADIGRAAQPLLGLGRSAAVDIDAAANLEAVGAIEQLDLQTAREVDEKRQARRRRWRPLRRFACFRRAGARLLVDALPFRNRRRFRLRALSGEGFETRLQRPHFCFGRVQPSLQRLDRRGRIVGPRVRVEKSRQKQRHANRSAVRAGPFTTSRWRRRAGPVEK